MTGGQIRGLRAGARATFVGDGEVEVVVPMPRAEHAVNRSAA